MNIEQLNFVNQVKIRYFLPCIYNKLGIFNDKFGLVISVVFITLTFFVYLSMRSHGTQLSKCCTARFVLDTLQCNFSYEQIDIFIYYIWGGENERRNLKRNGKRVVPKGAPQCRELSSTKQELLDGRFLRMQKIQLETANDISNIKCRFQN